MLRYAALTGWGYYVPEKTITNDYLASILDTSDAWIRSRTGIAERRIAGPNETTASMCLAAGNRALRKAKLDPRALDLVICATTTPDHLLPATSCLVKQQLGATNAGAFDVNAACTGSLSALITGAQYIRCGTYERVLIVAGETLSRFVNWKDRATSVLFGDGADGSCLRQRTRNAGSLAPC